MYPRLKVVLDKELDKKVCFLFLNRKMAGIDFGKGIVKTHPSLSRIKNKLGEVKEKTISDYVDDFYSQHLSELKLTRKNDQEEWKKIEKLFFQTCDKFFCGHLWPKGKYIGYPSIFNCNPRFLADKRFQVFWKHPKGFAAVAAHEMLHFLFFDIFEKKFSGVEITEREAWSLSEVTNYLLLKEPEFVQITNDTAPDLYPNLDKMKEHLVQTWKREKSVQVFLKLAIKNRSFLGE